MLKNILAAAALAALALPAEAGALRDVVLDVKGMTCAACPVTVKVVLKQQPGVEEVRMDAEKNTADVKFDPAKVSPEQLARAVTEAGFPATPRK
jgi:mercuric ion binding protein